MWQMEDDSGEYESSGTPLSWSQPQKPSACQEKPILESVSSEVLTSRQQQYYWNALSNSHPFFLRCSDHQARKGVTVMTCVLALTFRRSSDYCYKMGQGNICLHLNDPHGNLLAGFDGKWTNIATWSRDESLGDSARNEGLSPHQAIHLYPERP